MAPAQGNWLRVGIIGIALSIILFSAGAYAENYREPAGPEHDAYGMPILQVSTTPFAGWAFPLVVFGLCALVVGIMGVLYDYKSTHARARKVVSSTLACLFGE